MKKLWLAVDPTQNRPNEKNKPAKTKLSVLAQLCKLIPGHLVGKLARENCMPDILRYTPMRAALEAGRAKDPAFLLAKDGVHPGREGHWIMAREILTQCFGAKLDGIDKAEDLFVRNGDEIRKLVAARRSILFASYMTKIGHQRPGVPGHPKAKPGPSIEEASAKAADLTRQIESLLK